VEVVGLFVATEVEDFKLSIAPVVEDVECSKVEDIGLVVDSGVIVGG
jgi:hypothetical protein